MNKTLKYSLIGLASFFLILLGFYILLRWAKQDEFLKYDDGVTIEVYNSSEQAITDLSFYIAFDRNQVHQDVGTIDVIGPGESTSLYTHQIKDTGNDKSLYLHYPINKTKADVESLAYLASNKPSKVVVILEITGIDNTGRLLFRVRGYEDVFGKYEFDLSSTRE
ncbi:hypothetical protein [Psychrobacillus sp. NPDC093180]|uniref:hypothetical protein n=1 Tax=Psychrobacillus sp. NPDC093180 TaxID=3364489 RepID=UPI0038011ECC